MAPVAMAGTPNLPMSGVKESADAQTQRLEPPVVVSSRKYPTRSKVSPEKLAERSQA